MNIWQRILQLFRSNLLTPRLSLYCWRKWTLPIGCVVVVFLPLMGLAQFSDDFTVDASLNTGVWETSTGVLKALAGKFNSALLVPTLSFDQSGMTFSGVNRSNELAGVQSRVAYTPPFTLTTTVTAEEAHGN